MRPAVGPRDGWWLTRDIGDLLVVAFVAAIAGALFTLALWIGDWLDFAAGLVVLGITLVMVQYARATR